MKHAVLKAATARTLAPLLVLALAVVALYGRFLSSPLVFDDYSYPNYYNPYLGRAQVHEAPGDPAAARLDYARSCSLGVVEVCHLGTK